MTDLRQTGAPPARVPAPSGGRAPARRRRSGPLLGRLRPYLLILPSLVALGALFGYPLFLVARISFQRLGLGELVRRQTVYVGVANYRGILTDRFFWTVVLRTVLFTVANVTLTMLLGTLIALLLVRLGRVMRLAVSTALVLAWATPIVTAVVLWQWLFDTQYGVVNWLLTALKLGDYGGHSWFSSQFSTFGVITAIIVWQAVPFVVFSLQAGLLSIPRELYEAARVDGAGAWRTFWTITFPLVRPVFAILAFLSVIWDFRVFTQVWAVRQGGPDRSTITLPVYMYIQGIASSHFGSAAAISLVTVGLLAALLAYYIRHMVRTEAL